MKPEFEYELLAMFIRNEIGAAFTMPALYALFAIASMFWAPVSDGVLWLVIVIIAKILLLDQGRRFLALPQNQVDVRLWRRRFIMIELLLVMIGGGNRFIFEHDLLKASFFQSRL